LIGLVGTIGCGGGEKESELEVKPLPPSTGIETELYTNSEYGFSIEYPTDWDLEEDYMGMVVGFFGPVLENSYMVNVNVQIEEIPKEMTVRDYAKACMLTAKKTCEDFQQIEEYKTTTIDGCDAIVDVITLTVTEGEQVFALKDITAMIVRDRKGYMLIYDVLENYHDEYLYSFNEAIRTFKFQ
jgi:hypothetical protein